MILSYPAHFSYFTPSHQLDSSHHPMPSTPSTPIPSHHRPRNLNGAAVRGMCSPKDTAVLASNGSSPPPSGALVSRWKAESSAPSWPVSVVGGRSACFSSLQSPHLSNARWESCRIGQFFLFHHQAINPTSKILPVSREKTVSSASTALQTHDRRNACCLPRGRTVEKPNLPVPTQPSVLLGRPRVGGTGATVVTLSRAVELPGEFTDRAGLSQSLPVVMVVAGDDGKSEHAPNGQPHLF
ncbi:hypothetical protein K402DRAFT_67494 [Aulographum hederae CBS 113979]|uniref:Uncharacterized protein n=1 Tax=Aulographum hederae CBS 113979 TaxID=1176131 RepID=A0A6G1H1H7_9PEZI|nr:hypothetical protein K402DRAFT_67494 [Aulographum hederae CBS 113979]